MTQPIMVRLFPVFALAASLVACASDPRDILGTKVDSSPYLTMTCQQIFAQYQATSADLAALSAEQSQKRQNDTVGVMLTFLPVNSMLSENLAPKIAEQKGRLAALEDASYAHNCAMGGK